MHYYRCRTAKVMYVEDQLLNLKGGATYLCNNLDVVNSKEETTGEQINVYTVVHKAEVELVYSEVNGGGVSHTQRVSCRSDHKEETVIITQARWCVLTKDKVILVVTTYVGFQIFNSSGTTLLMNYELSQASMHGPDGHFCRGIANHGNKIFVGTSSGGVLVLNEMKITGELCSATTSSPVCDIQCSKSGHVAISDEGGLITLWQPNHQENTIFGWKGVPCVSIGMCGDVVVAGFSTGHLRLYSMSQASLLVEITAHAQTVMSLDVDVASRKLLTVSEDCTLALWELPGVGETQVTHLFSQQIPNKQLCGAKFLGSEDRFALTAYDWNEIILYKRT